MLACLLAYFQATSLSTSLLLLLSVIRGLGRGYDFGMEMMMTMTFDTNARGAQLDQKGQHTRRPTDPPACHTTQRSLSPPMKKGKIF
ncbi:hypothetical protein IWX49DRAFT_568797 [Phyllosticta citricarpa]